MSEYKTKIVLGVVLAVVIATGLAVASMAIAPNFLGSSTQSQHSTSQLSGPSVLLVQLTDPPIVPAGTTSLNLTYSSISLLVAEPSTTTETSTSTITSPTTSTVTTTITKTLSNVVNQPTSVSIPAAGGSATVNLLKLQNISQTIASANLPNGTTIYSVSLNLDTAVTSNINIAINGVTYPVTLAASGTSLLVTLSKPAVLEGTNAVLLDLTPTVVNTTSGYQMIPSSVGIIKPQSEITSQQHQIGHQDQLTDQDQQDIHSAAGQLTANLTTLSLSGSTTTISVNVTNTGSAAIDLVAIGVQGNFTAQNPSCTSTTTSTTTSTDNNHQQFHFPIGCEGQFDLNEMVFVPTSTTTTTTTAASPSCSTGTMSPVDLRGMGDNNHLTVSPGQCVVLTFTGTLSLGGHGVTVVPNTSSGQQYIVHVIGSDNAQMTLSCVLPPSATSCTPIHDNSGGQGQGQNYGQGQGQNYGQGQGQD